MFADMFMNKTLSVQNFSTMKIAWKICKIINHKPVTIYDASFCRLSNYCSHGRSRSTARQPAYGIRPLGAGPEVLRQRCVLGGAFMQNGWTDFVF